MDSLSQAERELKISRPRVSEFLSKGKADPIDKRYIIKKLQKTYVKSVKVVESWHIGIQIEVLDLDTNTTAVYSTIRSASYPLWGRREPRDWYILLLGNIWL